MTGARDDLINDTKALAAQLRIIAAIATSTARELNISPPREKEALQSILRNVERMIKGGCVVTKEPDSLSWIAERCRIGLLSEDLAQVREGERK